MKKFLSTILICVFAIITTIFYYNLNIKSYIGVDTLNILKPNIPIDIRKLISLSLKKESIDETYGPPLVTRNLTNITYEIRKLRDSSKLIVSYDNDTKNVLDIWQLNKFLTKCDFNNIFPSQSSSKDIFKIDPYTTIIETSDGNAISEHKLRNSEILDITYSKKNNHWIVESMNFSSSEILDISNLIIPEDLYLLK